MEKNDWQVILIGGNSGAGKTYIAHELVRQLGVSNLQVDDIRIGIQQVTTPIEQPDLHVFLNYTSKQWEQPEKIVKDWIRVGTVMAKPLQAIIEHHIAAPLSGKVIIEGDGILPELANQNIFANETGQVELGKSREMRLAFLIEDNEERILENLRKRGRGFDRTRIDLQNAFAHASWLYGQWLSQEAKSRNIAVVSSHPNGTAIERVLESIHLH